MPNEITERTDPTPERERLQKSRDISALMAQLGSSYPSMPDKSAGQVKTAMKDLVADLMEYPLHAIHEACESVRSVISFDIGRVGGIINLPGRWFSRARPA